MGKKGSGTNALGNLGKIDGDLRRCDANTDTLKDTASDEGSETIGGNLNCSANQPPKACKHNTTVTWSANMLKYKHGGRTVYLSRRPHLSEMGPAIKEPRTDPAARAELMAPYLTPLGLSK